ncbi:MAG: cobalamin-dependent protein [Longimicrobiales bacterium]|nr:cobalamin-dependent protein [Longimicrobiales bacterium]
MPTTDETRPIVELDPDPTLSTTQVGDLFEVHPSTVKRWCERGELSFHRTEGGHRRIPLSAALGRGPEGAVARELTAFGPDAGSVWLAEQEALSDLDFGRARELTDAWMDHRDFQRIKEFLAYLGRNHPDILPHLLDGVTREVMRGVGQWWEEGRLGVGGEHLASETVTEALFQLRRDLISVSAGSSQPTTPASGRVALVGCYEGERHAIGAHAVRLLLEQRGWQVRFLGADVPVDTWEELQKEYGADLVCISFSSLRAWSDVARTVRRLAERYDPDRSYALALGGGMVGALSEAAREEDRRIYEEELAALSESTPFEALRVFPGTVEFTEWLAGLEQPTA